MLQFLVLPVLSGSWLVRPGPRNANSIRACKHTPGAWHAPDLATPVALLQESVPVGSIPRDAERSARRDDSRNRCLR